MAKVVPISIDISKGKLTSKPKGIEMVECKTIEEIRRDQERSTAKINCWVQTIFLLWL